MWLIFYEEETLQVSRWFLLYDEVREPQTYLAVLKAIGAGYHTLSEISNESLIGKTHLSATLPPCRSCGWSNDAFR